MGHQPLGEWRLGLGMDWHRRQELRQEIGLFKNPGLAVDESRTVYIPVKKALTVNNQSPGFFLDLDGNLPIGVSNSGEVEGEEEKELSPRIESQSLKGPYLFRDRETEAERGSDLAKVTSQTQTRPPVACQLPPSRPTSHMETKSPH